MRLDFRRRQRRTFAALVALYVATAAALLAATDDPALPGGAEYEPTITPEFVHAHDAPVVNHPRLCAAVAVYTVATGDYWDQRAAIARATLNRFAVMGQVPDCGGPLTALVANGVDDYLWQASLDAVDAVESGSYDLPDACVRADSIAPVSRPAGQRPPSLLAIPEKAPPADPAARTHCVFSGLAFFQAVTP